MSVNKDEGIRYANAVTYHFNECYNACVDQGYFVEVGIPTDASDAKVEGYSNFNKFVKSMR